MNIATERYERLRCHSFSDCHKPKPTEAYKKAELQVLLGEDLVEQLFIVKAG